MIRLLCSPALQKTLNGLLLSDLQPPCSDYGLEHDALRDGYPLLLSYDFDMLRLSRFRTALSLRGITGHLICFDFQIPVLEKYIDSNVHFSSIDLDKFRKEFLNEP